MGNKALRVRLVRRLRLYCNRFIRTASFVHLEGHLCHSRREISSWQPEAEGGEWTRRRKRRRGGVERAEAAFDVILAESWSCDSRCIFHLSLSSTKMATAAYPAWEDISSPPPASTASSSSTPSPAPSTSRSLTSSLARFFSLFPLHQFPAAQPLYPEDDTRVTKPTLYVAPGHARERNGRVERTWTSADARCLRWQMELLFRSSPSLQGYEVDGSRASTSGSKSTGHFDCEQIEHQDAWGPKIDSLPYLQLPPHGKGKVVPSSTAYVPSAPPRLLDDEALPTWAETRWPFEWEKVEKHGAEEERGQKTSGPYESEEKRLEAEMWTSLLEGKIMGAVVSCSKSDARMLQRTGKADNSDAFSAAPSTNDLLPAFQPLLLAPLLLPPPHPSYNSTTESSRTSHLHSHLPFPAALRHPLSRRKLVILATLPQLLPRRAPTREWRGRRAWYGGCGLAGGGGVGRGGHR